jgi:hypothetical protein
VGHWPRLLRALRRGPRRGARGRAAAGSLGNSDFGVGTASGVAAPLGLLLAALLLLLLLLL